MSVNTELQALLTKMGGSPSEEDSNSDLIKKISNAYDGSGGGSGGVTIAHCDASTNRLDMKAGDLFVACTNGPVFVIYDDSGHGQTGTGCELILGAYFSNVRYAFRCSNSSYSAESADEYPIYDDSES